MLTLMLCIGWFVFLWGLGTPSVLAGLALSMLVLTALRKGAAHAADRREEALRRRLGGEMVMEELMLAPPRQAHFRAGLILAEKYPFIMDKITDSGLFCHDAKGDLLIFCLSAPPQTSISPQALLPLLRAAKSSGSKRCIACATAGFSRDCTAFAELSDPPIQLFDRNKLLPLAGRLSPATDEQLAALARRKRRMPLRTAAAHVFARCKARRYMSCGIALCSVYIVTGLRWYVFPALLCMLFAAMCRARKEDPEHL